MFTTEFDTAAHLKRLGLETPAGPRRTFTAHDLASSPLPIEELSVLIRAAPYNAPRSAHAADWSDIFAYRSGVLDYNAIVCVDMGIGTPFIYDFTQTEASAGTSGDTLFRPASRYEGGVRTPLRLRHFRDGRMRDAHAEGSYFVPFVDVAEIDFEGRLTDLHVPTIGGRHMQIHSRFLVEHAGALRTILHGLFAHVEAGVLRLGSVVDRVVDRSGLVSRVTAEFEEGRFVVGNRAFGSAEELVEACLEIPRIAASPSRLLDILAGASHEMPLFSLDMVLVLHAVIGSDWTAHGEERPTISGGFHLHWGALAMAGCPPARKGYFASKGKRSRKLFELAMAAYGRNETMDFVLAPAAPFLLWSTATDSALDDERVDALVADVLGVEAGDIAEAVRRTRIWWTANVGNLSGGFKRKLKWQDRTSSGGAVASRTPRAPEGFGQLTLGQANTIAGTLHGLATASG